ncbi:MAG: hypothetical protein JKX72_05885 [Robiginitomaculum sp.]|nr:hypothetical protein [Robiginitomaculum sp.]
MSNYDIFNGDADGLCALLQLRRADPRTATLITGVKREINLLERVTAKAGDHLTVLDISMRTNQVGLKRALSSGANIFYVDHHNSGSIPKHKNLFAVIDTSPTICTSLLVNKCLNGQYADWAIVGAFGDNMGASANVLAKKLDIGDVDMLRLKNFGELINYNAYGRDVSDLHFAPDEMFKRLLCFKTPQACLEASSDIIRILEFGFQADMEKADLTTSLAPNIFLLGDAPWARRISGSFGNKLARENPDQAHGVLTHNVEGGFTVSVRASLNSPKGADILCLQFPTGGGRAGAAGINHLPKEDLDKFLAAFKIGF